MNFGEISTKRPCISVWLSSPANCVLHNPSQLLLCCFSNGKVSRFRQILHAETEELINVQITIIYAGDACKPFSARIAEKLVDLRHSEWKTNFVRNKHGRKH